MTDLNYLSIVELSALIRGKQLSPVELTRSVLERAERLQPTLNCFITLCGDAALEAARIAEQEITAGQYRGPLHGIPYAAKDLVDTAGVRTTYGTLAYKDHVPGQDAVAVARLRQAGAVLFGKTTTPEFGSQCITRSPLFGDTRNAWSAAHSSGGSSGGAAVAVAAGIGPIGIATDGGGSTRIPAAVNGVVGLKQSLGVVPHSQAQDAFGNQTYVTPISRNVMDTVLMLDAMAGAHGCDPWASARGTPAVWDEQTPPSLAGRRIKYCLAPKGKLVEPSVEQAFQAALNTMADAGAKLEPFEAGEEFDVEPIWRTVNHTVWRSRFGKLVQDRPQDFSATFIRQIESAQHFTAADYQEAMFARTRLFRHVENLLGDADILVTPTLLRPALPLDQDLYSPFEIAGQRIEGIRSNWFPWTMPFNMTGNPAISLPNGFDAAGLPIGIQFIGSLGRDKALLKLALAFEALTPQHYRQPIA
ncbi:MULTISPECIES: amidase [unclassified Achromobacter]|uniref:amidase n=1 Tax=unclassified Achromobacter TaxID=2626865 RepID=UPI000B51A65C|nr:MULTISPECIES: amidase [unclassified Achromobacter]OWT80717.1 glutamyl-tRNA amidotransferase [Achromobacter sp. HZ34]OWT81233.1 glutamyl-tRNA amidotransferase [Achromobacter sp. HZ28]